MTLGVVIARANVQSKNAMARDRRSLPGHRAAADYVSIATDEWARAAQRVAMDALYSTGPILVRRVASRRPGADS